MVGNLTQETESGKAAGAENKAAGAARRGSKRERDTKSRHPMVLSNTGYWYRGNVLDTSAQRIFVGTNRLE